MSRANPPAAVPAGPTSPQSNTDMQRKFQGTCSEAHIINDMLRPSLRTQSREGPRNGSPTPGNVP